MALKFIILNKIIYYSFPSKYYLISGGINNKLYTSVHRKRVAGDNSENNLISSKKNSRFCLDSVNVSKFLSRSKIKYFSRMFIIFLYIMSYNFITDIIKYIREVYICSNPFYYSRVL
jgi:hypothetical protein